MSQAGLLADPAEVRAILISSAAARQPITYSKTLALLGKRLHPAQDACALQGSRCGR